MAKPSFEFSAGGVVVKDDTVLLIRARNLKGRDVWTFPKGRLNEGERSPEAALREVEEETGWRCRIERELPRSEYWFQQDGRRIHKTVRWFKMTAIERVREPDREVEEVVWLPVVEAGTRLTYESDRHLLAQALAEGSAPESEPSG
jgi:8-oxo-dGTP diphosphatase